MWSSKPHAADLFFSTVFVALAAKLLTSNLKYINLQRSMCSSKPHAADLFFSTVFVALAAK